MAERKRNSTTPRAELNRHGLMIGATLFLFWRFRRLQVFRRVRWKGVSLGFKLPSQAIGLGSVEYIKGKPVIFITLGRPLVEVAATLLHEMSHVAHYGRYGHDRKWSRVLAQATTEYCGAPVRSVSSREVVDDAVEIALRQHTPFVLRVLCSIVDLEDSVRSRAFS